ncbi:MAG: hypothetical protein WCN95_14665, partial [bacterium]
MMNMKLRQKMDAEQDNMNIEKRIDDGLFGLCILVAILTMTVVQVCVPSIRRYWWFIAFVVCAV